MSVPTELSPETGQALPVKARRPSYGHTGPKSLAGRNKVRWNALKDGTTAKSALLPFEDERLYRRHIREVEGALKPTNYVEVQLVREYAEGLWRINRHEKRGAYEREKILSQITPQMVAGILELDEHLILSAPSYLTNLKYKISKAETQEAKKMLSLYRHLVANASGIANFNMVWGQYQDLYKALHVWKSAQGPNTNPVLNSLGAGLNLVWQQDPKTFLKLLDRFANHLFYVAHFESVKPQIRVWMECWFFAQKTEMRRLEASEQLLMKERNHVHGLLEKISRLRKSNVYLDQMPPGIGLMAKAA